MSAGMIAPCEASNCTGTLRGQVVQVCVHAVDLRVLPLQKTWILCCCQATLRYCKLDSAIFIAFQSCNHAITSVAGMGSAMPKP